MAPGTLYTSVTTTVEPRTGRQPSATQHVRQVVVGAAGCFLMGLAGVTLLVGPGMLRAPKPSTEVMDGMIELQIDEEDTCNNYPTWKFQSSTRDNLGKKGEGGSSGKEGIILHTKTNTKANALNGLSGKEFDLHVHAESEYSIRRAGHALPAGSEFCSIVLVSGTQLKINITLTEHGHDTPVEVPVFYLTFFDIDQKKLTGDDTFGESIEVNHAGQNFEPKLEVATEVEETQAGDRYTISSKEEGQPGDNPRSYKNLTLTQKKRSVTFKWEKFTKAEITLKAGGPNTFGQEKPHWRAFQFVAIPSVLCAITSDATATSTSTTEPTQIASTTTNATLKHGTCMIGEWFWCSPIGDGTDMTCSVPLGSVGFFCHH